MPHERVEMSYTLLRNLDIISNRLMESGLSSNIIVENNMNWLTVRCTNRPALSPKGEISRNKVDVAEAAS